MSDNLFKTDTESVLVKGLNAMTKACDALIEQNEILNLEIEELSNKISRMQDRILIETSERE